MIDYHQFKNLISKRLAELNVRMHDIDAELGHANPKDLEDQAIDLEDDEVLEGLGVAAQVEVGLLKQALERMKDGTYGVCLECSEEISPERLKAVLHAPLCRRCAGAEPH